MLEKLRHHYRRAKTITLILDNYIIHKSKQTVTSYMKPSRAIINAEGWQTCWPE